MDGHGIAASRVVLTRWASLIALALSAVGCSRPDERTATPPSAQPERAIVDPVAARLAPVSPGHFINSLVVEELHRQGLQDPVTQIVDSLMAHPELIPHEGVLGGTMGFYYEEGIHILDESWLYAHFDDGHISGRGIFEYTVLPDSSLTFKAVHTVVD